MVDDYQLFVESFKIKSGIDLNLYKESQMKKRLDDFRIKKGAKTFHELSLLMKKDKHIYHELLDKITINVSEFYRNANRWEVLEKKVLPRLLKKNKKLKIWSAACSTGDEPYTIAMILSKTVPLANISILASDIDENSLKKAKEGIYMDRAVQDVPEDMLKKHFTKDGKQWKISNEIKSVVRFQHQNLLNGEFDTDFDLIVCRNVLIYFTEEAKEMLFQKFSKALKPGGVLFVGGTEQIFHQKEYGFESEDIFFYQKKD